MQSLSWLPPFLRHSPAVAIALGVAAFLASMIAAVARRRRAATRRVQAALARDATVTGTLVAERPLVDVAVLGFGRGDELVEHAPVATDAAIDDGPRRVVLDGAFAITAGSRVVRHHAVPTDHFEAATVARDKVRRAMQMNMWPSGIDAYHVRYLRPGDEVRAHGRLVEDAGAWRLVGDGKPIELVARAAVVDPVPLPPLGAMARAALVGVAIWIAASALAAW